jgi:rare lipoprotein A
MRGERKRGVLNSLLLCGCMVLLVACASKPGKEQGDPAVADLSGVQPIFEPPSRYGNPETYTVFGKNYRVRTTSAGHRERGIASWYGKDFHGKRTSSGTPYDMYAISAAHKTLPIPTYVRVTRLDNGSSLVVRVDDRGPFVEGRVIDLSYGAARKLGMVEQGTAPVEVIALQPYQYLARHEGPRDDATMLAEAASTRPSAAPQPAAPLPTVRVSTSATSVPRELVAVGPDLAATVVGNAYLQVGAFSDRQRAEQLRGLLSGTLRHDVHLASSGTTAMHRVRIGPLSDPAEVDRARLELAELGIRQTYLVHD